MQAFALLLDTLTTTPSRKGKLTLLVDYFRTAPDPDRGFALAALTDGLFPRLPLRRSLATLLETRVDPVLYALSRDYVGDTAETVALMWPAPAISAPAERGRTPSLSEVVASLANAPPTEVAPILGDLLDRLDVRGRWALLKLVGGAPRVGVSARLAKTALAEMSGHAVSEIEEIWHALEPPYSDLFLWLTGNGPRPDAGGKPVFRPLMLAHAIEEQDWSSFAPEEFAAEWKWDGIRVQIAAHGEHVRIFSRTGDDISRSFPEIVSAFLGREVLLDGELLVARDGLVAPFNDLQQRLNRKAVTGRMLKDHPAHVRLYDLLIDGSEDLREMSFRDRRKRLEAWFAAKRPPLADISPLVPFATRDELDALWGDARETGIEGLMLKRWSSPYLSGRPRGHWFKWKRAALTLDCVLMYAQRGSGKRSSYYSDYTFGVWRELAEPALEGTPRGDIYPGHELVPVGKAYSGFTDAELLEIDRFVRNHTVEQFGPVRAVEPRLVLEVAFDAIFASSRHKSGLAMRFPRIHRIRWDKPPQEADTLDTAKRLMEQPAAENAKQAPSTD
ncbi:cisplatin damage response ATP-dependent DNA ligase [Hyphomicrobium sp. LHD-15]|uniref:cisplatin damage response ATP-dependent DNA ligase n=1 Tax=Hyphomicrobium sp. LHD-15 TaxID=3072142 RepID=UPI00280E92F7|nr:cisplatin damage response ATP-dependent DNA ligase [Hyphomicrobium sp. LHD-15]MDQ8700477.1 cisplatin damage response ATP-dependent DNA ligase [Hyphomicrobium sp. LHD-15]